MPPAGLSGRGAGGIKISLYSASFRQSDLFVGLLMTYPIFFLCLQLVHFVLQSLEGLLDVWGGSRHLDDVAVVLGRGDGDVDLILPHHRPHILTLLADDEAVQVVRDSNLLGYWYQLLQSYMNHEELEWGCPNGTKYPPRQPIPNRAILPNRARLQTDGQTDGRTGWFQYTPLTSLRGV